MEHQPQNLRMDPELNLGSDSSRSLNNTYFSSGGNLVVKPRVIRPATIIKVHQFHPPVVTNLQGNSTNCNQVKLPILKIQQPISLQNPFLGNQIGNGPPRYIILDPENIDSQVVIKYGNGSPQMVDQSTQTYNEIEKPQEPNQKSLLPSDQKSDQNSQKESNSKSGKKRYSRVGNEQRAYLIDLIFTQGIKIKKAAEIAGVGYENAKFISKVFKKEGRNYKKNFKNVKKPRKVKQNNKDSSSESLSQIEKQDDQTISEKNESNAGVDEIQ